MTQRCQTAPRYVVGRVDTELYEVLKVQRRPVFGGVFCRPLPADACGRWFSPGCLSRFRRTPVKPFHHQMLRRNLVGMGEKCLF